MTVLTTDIVYYKSSDSGSVGGAISATTITSGVLNNLWDDVPASEALAGATEYRKIFVKNTNGSDSLLYAILWRNVDTLSSDDEIQIGIGTASDDDGSSVLTALTEDSRITLVSDGSDVRVVTLIGEDADGDYQTENVTLTSTTPVDSVNTYSRLYLAYPASSSGSRIITITQKTTSVTLGTIGVSKLSAILYLNPTSKAVGFQLGTLAAGASHGIWLKRVVTAGAEPYNLNSGTIKVEGETS